MSLALAGRLVVCVAVAATGCASIVDGTTQVLSFNSNPNAAHVLVNGTEVGTTPLSTQVKRSSDTVVMFRKDGYADQTMTLQTKLNSWFWGNIICGGVLGSTTDGLSGAVREYAPNSYYATLEPTESSKLASRPSGNVQTDRVGAVRDFVLVNFDSLRREAQGGAAGEYVRALNRLLFDADKAVLSLTELQTALGACDGPVHCAERLADGN